MRRSFSLFSALVLSFGPVACSGDGPDLGPSATLGTAPTTSASERVIDPSVIPADTADIDEAYVQAVVDALFAVDAKATEIFVETKDVTNKEALDYLRAIYVQDEFEQQVNVWFHDLALRSDQLLPGALGNDVKRVIDVAPDCVYAEVLRDYSETTTREVTRGEIFVGITPKADGEDAEGLNPTAWMMFMDGLNVDGSEPENPCEGR
ncbi:MAG TPA: hypothetical protein VGV93_07695 [Acidimicrobiales bacterium]|nr:hypothetical protein [Acidimicrobiales bacterium]